MFEISMFKFSANEEEYFIFWYNIGVHTYIEMYNSNSVVSYLFDRFR